MGLLFVYGFWLIWILTLTVGTKHSCAIRTLPEKLGSHTVKFAPLSLQIPVLDLDFSFALSKDVIAQIAWLHVKFRFLFRSYPFFPFCRLYFTACHGLFVDWRIYLSLSPPLSLSVSLCDSVRDQQFLHQKKLKKIKDPTEVTAVKRHEKKRVPFTRSLIVILKDNNGVPKTARLFVCGDVRLWFIPNIWIYFDMPQVEIFNLPVMYQAFGDFLRSDHYSFWLNDYKAIFITDTGNTVQSWEEEKQLQTL